MVLKMIFNFNWRHHSASSRSHGHLPDNCLAALPIGDKAVIVGFETPARVSEHLMNLGIAPGVEVEAARRSPIGGPRIYRVDGMTEIALRKGLAARIIVARCACTKEEQ